MPQRFPGTVTSVHVSTRLLPSSARHLNPSVHSTGGVLHFYHNENFLQES